MTATPDRVGQPIVRRLPLSRPRERVFGLLDPDAGRERHWTVRSHSSGGGFELEFSGGLKTYVEVLERRSPARLAIRYFGAESIFDLAPHEDGGCLFQVTCRCEDAAEWLELYPGWVGWLLVLEAAADFGVDLPSGSGDRTRRQRYVDP
jgi:hypothetical protein